MIGLNFLLNKRFKLSKSFVLTLLAIMALLFSYISYDFSNGLVQKKMLEQFKQDSQEEATSIQSNIENNLAALYSMEVFFKTENKVSRQQFSMIADLLFKRFPSILAIMWVPKISDAERNNYVAGMRKDFPSFNIYERNVNYKALVSPNRKEYLPISYIAPLLENERLLGYDLLTEAGAQSAIGESRDLGIMTASSRVVIPSRYSQGHSVLAFVPLYRSGVELDTLEKRYSNFIGFIVGAYSVGDFIKNALEGKRLFPIDIEVSDLSAPANENFLYYFNYRSGEKTLPIYSFEFNYKINFANRTWLLHCTPHALYYTKDKWVSRLVFIMSLLGFAILIFFINKFYDTLEQSEKLANLDSLTHLPNRYYFEAELKSSILRAEQEHKSIALFFIDVDKFKDINDIQGHHVGDLFLKAVAKRLRECLRDSDFISRLGGDEFAVILYGVKSRKQVDAIAKKILKRFREQFLIAKKQINTSLSVGVAYYPFDAGDAETLLQKADTAMYRVKRSGRDNFQNYAEE